MVMGSERQPHQKRSLVIMGVIFLISLVLMINGAFNALERKSVDMRLRLWRQKRAPEAPIALILIDDASLDAMAPMVGRWPWPRRVHAQLIDFLALSGAKAVVMDLIFSEAQQGVYSGASDNRFDDQRLGDATASAGNVYQALQLVRLKAQGEPGSDGGGRLSEDFKRRFGLPFKGDGGPEYQEAYPPLSDLCTGAAGVGVVSFKADADGVFRRERLVFSHAQGTYPALGLAPALDLLDIKGLVSQGDTLVLQSTGGVGRRIPLDPEKRYHINPYGRFETYSYSGVYLSALKLANGQFDGLPVDPSLFENKVVFIGASAGGIGDLKATALDTSTPGVYLHAALMANIMAEDYVHFPPRWADAAVVLLLLFLTVWAVFQRPTYFQKVGLPLALAAVYLLIAAVLAGKGLMLDLWDPLFAIAGGFLSAITLLSFTDGRERRRIRGILGQYVAPTVLAKVLSNPAEDLLTAEVGSQEHLTLLFSDLRGFTAITEQYAVETVVRTLNAYLSRMVSIIFDQGGTLDKFIGDAIMAFWGAPLKDDRQQYRAVAAALAMQTAMTPLNRSGESRGYPRLRMGIGIHSGDVILGNIGSTQKLDYTVIGDSVNFTARLESLTKQYQCGILISEATYRPVADVFCCRAVDRVCVQGKSESILIYEVLDFADTKNENLRQLAQLSTSGFDCYQQRDFGGAIKRYNQARELFPYDPVGRLFIERCEHYLDSPPPPSWGGEFVCQSK
jgi:adenylate cyclase